MVRGVHILICFLALSLRPGFADVEATGAAQLPTHVILRAAGPIVVDGVLDEPSWTGAITVGDFVFPWWKEGEREQTEARLLWDDTNLYVSFVAQDKHVSAAYKNRDDPVSKDDCVEVFVMPDTANVGHYYNIEANVLGTVLDRFQLAEPTGSYTAQVEVATRIDGSLNDETDEDRGFVSEFAIPFDSFVDTAPHIPPQPGDVWRLNLYRIGGMVNFQYSMWSDTLSDKPKYHAPERFGVVHFSASAVPVDGVGTQTEPAGKMPE